MIPGSAWIYEKMKLGKLAIAYNGSVIVKLRAEEFDGFTIEEIVTGFMINYSKFIQEDDVVVDPQTALTWQRPSSNRQHWHNARNDVLRRR